MKHFQLTLRNLFHIHVLLIAFMFGCKTSMNCDLVISNINIIDVETGQLLSNYDVAVIDDSIASISKSGKVLYSSTLQIDGTGKYLIPGLWDMHTHGYWACREYFPLLLANGITGVREMFGDPTEVKSILDQIESDDIIGPDMITSGPIVDGVSPRWPTSSVASSAEEGRRIVREQKEQGADFIKVYDKLDKDVYWAISDECKKLGIPMAGHIPSRISLEEAIKADQISIEHMVGLLEFCSSKSDIYYQLINDEIVVDSLIGFTKDRFMRAEFIINTFDSTKMKSLAALLAKSNTWVCPTNVVWKGLLKKWSPDQKISDWAQYMPGYILDDWKIPENYVFTDQDLFYNELDLQLLSLRLSLLKPLADAGVGILAGTDYANPHTFPGFSLHQELEIMVKEGGLSPHQALQTATINPAKFLKKDEKTGSIRMGNIATMLLLNKNPLLDIANTQSIDAMILRGKHYNATFFKDSIEVMAAKYMLIPINDTLTTVINTEGIDFAVTLYHKLMSENPKVYNFEEEQLNSLGYYLLENKKIPEAIVIFELNVEIYPNYANGFDSLGDAYLAANEKQKAKKVWEKAVEMGVSETKEKLLAL